MPKNKRERILTAPFNLLFDPIRLDAYRRFVHSLPSSDGKVLSLAEWIRSLCLDAYTEGVTRDRHPALPEEPETQD